MDQWNGGMYNVYTCVYIGILVYTIGKYTIYMYIRYTFTCAFYTVCACYICMHATGI